MPAAARPSDPESDLLLWSPLTYLVDRDSAA